jgi:enoyl-[acyl-carrier protein] reductase II
MVREAIDIPLIAAGGIATGKGMLAAMALGADGVQIGSRFVASEESSAHQSFKKSVVDAKDGDTALILKKIIPVRLIKNAFYERVKELENKGASREELAELLGRGRAKLGMFEGDLNEGELEIGQISGLINEIKPAKEIVNEIIVEFEQARDSLQEFRL